MAIGAGKASKREWTMPLMLQSPQLKFTFTLTDTCLPYLRNYCALVETGWDHGLQNDPEPGLRNKIIEITCYGPSIVYTVPPQFILGGNLQLVIIDPTSIAYDIKQCKATVQIVRLTTFSASYIALPRGLAPKQNVTWRIIHHLSSPSGHSFSDYIPHA